MGNYISCNCSCACVKEPSRNAGFVSESRRKLVPNTTIVIHGAQGRVLELGDGEPMKVAEIMLDYPGHFVTEYEIDPKTDLTAKSFNMAMLKRAAPLPADKEALPGHVYVLFPMHRLHSRVSPEELTSLMGLFSSHFLSAHQPPCTRRVRTLQSLMQANSATAKVTPLSCTPTSEEEEIVIPAHLSASHHHEDASDGEDDIDALLQEFCAIAKNSPFSSAGSLHNSGSLARSRSWMPKLETINESSTLAE